MKKKVLTKEETRRIMDRVSLQGASLSASGLRESQFYEIIKVIAEKSGGEVLSRKYINQYTMMEFKCREGHKFAALPINIIHGHWCRKCGLKKRSANTKKAMVEKLRLVAQYHGGNILFTEKEYEGSKTPMTFVCGEGHKWETTPTQIMQGHWCPECKEDSYKVTRRATSFAKLQKELKRRHWKFIGPEYTRLKETYTFMCSKGHKFTTTGNNCLQTARCPVCKREKRR